MTGIRTLGRARVWPVSELRVELEYEYDRYQNFGGRARVRPVSELRVALEYDRYQNFGVELEYGRSQIPVLRAGIRTLRYQNLRISPKSAGGVDADPSCELDHPK